MQTWALLSILITSQTSSSAPGQAAELSSKAEAGSSKLRGAVEDYFRMRREAAKLIGAFIGATGTYSGRCMYAKMQALRGAKRTTTPLKIVIQTEEEALTDLLTIVRELQGSLATLLPEDEGYWQSVLKEFSDSPLLAGALNTEAIKLIALASDHLSGLGAEGPLAAETFDRKDVQKREVSQILQALEGLISSTLNQNLNANSPQDNESKNKRKETDK